MLKTEIVPVDDGFARAVADLSAGLLVAVPTETVYGLAARADDGEAVASVYAAKGRPSFNPLIAHVADLGMAERVAHFDGMASRLAETFWPGPLTLVLPVRADAPIHPLARAGLDTVAIRYPHGVMADLARHIGVPLVAPSANASGRITSTTAEDVARSLAGQVGLILDGGQTSLGLESTIVVPDGDGALILRHGAVTPDEIEAAGVKIHAPATSTGANRPVAPGMLTSHYAPQARLRLDATHAETGECFLGFGAVTGGGDARASFNLSTTGNLVEAASNLFAMLNALDREGADRIAVAPIPPHGLGIAIRDRLARAAAPRDGA